MQVRVAAAPADGSANEELLRLLAKALDVPRSAVELVSGQANRHKRVSIPIGAAAMKLRLGVS